MLSSGLTEEQKLVKNLVSEFARKEIEPLASRLDRDCAFPGEIVSKLFDLGFMGHFVPERYGGSGLGCFSLSEPESGSDAASITAGAVKKDGRYVVTGIKSRVTNGSEAKVAVLSQEPTSRRKAGESRPS